MTTYGLVAIVKDEADRISDFLASAMAVCSVATIVDTGSTDGTQGVLAADPRISLTERPFDDFGHARSDAFAKARGTADWLLALDADMTVEVDGDFSPDPSVECYMVEMGNGGSFRWRLPLLLRGDLDWVSVGAVHEYTAHADGRPYISADTDSVRVRYPDRSSPAKSAWHAQLLEADLARDGGNPRTVFYLAESYRFLGRIEEARALYRRRAAMGGFAEEAYYAAYRAALLAPWPERAGELLTAWQMRPQRLEALHELLSELNRRDMHAAAYGLASEVSTVQGTDDILFVSHEAWDWGIDFERSIAAWWEGHRDEASDLFDRLLERDLPPHIRAATERNRSMTGI